MPVKQIGGSHQNTHNRVDFPIYHGLFLRNLSQKGKVTRESKKLAD